MSENPETAVESAPARDGDHRLRRALTWVGIVAGVVFIVAVVFFSGFALGRGSGGYHGWHRGHVGQMDPGGGPGGCPMMRSGAVMGPDMGPGMMRPGQPSTSQTPQR